MRLFLVAAAVAATLASPVVAARPAPVSVTNPAERLSVATPARATAPGKHQSRLAAPGGVFGIVLAAAVAIGALVLITDDGGNPDSN